MTIRRGCPEGGVRLGVPKGVSDLVCGFCGFFSRRGCQTWFVVFAASRGRAVFRFSRRRLDRLGQALSTRTNRGNEAPGRLGASSPGHATATELVCTGRSYDLGEEAGQAGRPDPRPPSGSEQRRLTAPPCLDCAGIWLLIALSPTFSKKIPGVRQRHELGRLGREIPGDSLGARR